MCTVYVSSFTPVSLTACQSLYILYIYTVYMFVCVYVFHVIHHIWCVEVWYLQLYSASGQTRSPVAWPGAWRGWRGPMCRAGSPGRMSAARPPAPQGAPPGPYTPHWPAHTADCRPMHTMHMHVVLLFAVVCRYISSHVMDNLLLTTYVNIVTVYKLFQSNKSFCITPLCSFQVQYNAVVMYPLEIFVAKYPVTKTMLHARLKWLL